MWQSRAWSPTTSAAEITEMENHQDSKGISIFACCKILILDGFLSASKGAKQHFSIRNDATCGTISQDTPLSCFSGMSFHFQLIPEFPDCTPSL